MLSSCKSVIAVIYGRQTLLYNIPPYLLRCCLKLAGLMDIGQFGVSHLLSLLQVPYKPDSSTPVSFMLHSDTRKEYDFLFLSAFGRVLYLRIVYGFVFRTHLHAQQLLLVSQSKKAE